MLVLTVIAVLLIACSLHAPSASASVEHNQEVDALLSFKLALEDRDSFLTSWDPTSKDPCTWEYITCEGGRVTRISLAGRNLAGKLVPELAKLEKLTNLHLYLNHLSGSIPPELGNLKELIILDLYNNALSGPLPASFGKLRSVEILRLNNNRLTGVIPSSLVALPNIKQLDVSYNNLSGRVPQGGSFAHIPSNSFIGNPGLCGPILKKAC